MASLRSPLSAPYGAPQKKRYRKLPQNSQNKFLFFLASLLACLGFKQPLNSFRRKRLAGLKHVKQYNRAVFAFNRLPQFAIYQAIIARDKEVFGELKVLYDAYHTPVLMARSVDRQRQLDVYLSCIGLFRAKHLISAAKIDLLEQNGIVSAAKIGRHMAKIKGIGMRITMILLDWREELAMKFIYVQDDGLIELLKRDIRATYPEKNLMLLLELDALQQQWAKAWAALLQAAIVIDKQHLKTSN